MIDDITIAVTFLNVGQQLKSSGGAGEASSSNLPETTTVGKRKNSNDDVVSRDK